MTSATPPQTEPWLTRACDGNGGAATFLWAVITILSLWLCRPEAGPAAYALLKQSLHLQRHFPKHHQATESSTIDYVPSNGSRTVAVPYSRQAPRQPLGRRRTTYRIYVSNGKHAMCSSACSAGARRQPGPDGTPSDFPVPCGSNTELSSTRRPIPANSGAATGALADNTKTYNATHIVAWVRVEWFFSSGLSDKAICF